MHVLERLSLKSLDSYCLSGPLDSGTQKQPVARKPVLLAAFVAILFSSCHGVNRGAVRCAVLKIRKRIIPMCRTLHCHCISCTFTSTLFSSNCELPKFVFWPNPDKQKEFNLLSFQFYWILYGCFSSNITQSEGLLVKNKTNQTKRVFRVLSWTPRGQG